MRYLDKEEKDTIPQTKKEKELNEELVELGNRIDANKRAIENEEYERRQFEENLENYLETRTIKTDALTSNTADIASIDSASIVTQSLNSDTGVIDELTNHSFISDVASIDDLTARTASLTKGEIASLTSDNVETSNLKSKTGEFELLNITNAEITNFDIENINTETISTDDLEALRIKADEANLDLIKAVSLETEVIEADRETLGDLQTHNIHYDDDRIEPYYIHIEPNDQPSATDFRIIELPYFDTGSYKLSLRDPLTNSSWWSVIVTNNFSNITVSYSRRTNDPLTLEDLTVPTLDEMIVWDYFSTGPKLYLKTYVGGNLYWQNISLNKEPEIAIYNNYPFDISQFGALHYKCLHTAATWFTHHIDLLRNQSLDNASLFLIPSDWNNATRSQIEYNTLYDVPFNYYIPDQSVNKNDEVTFRNLIITPLDGKYVYNYNNALMGHDSIELPDLITLDDGSEVTSRAGQLNPHSWLIDTSFLTKWDGKVGLITDNKVNKAGTIFRNQGYNLLEGEDATGYIYTKNPLTYDTVEYNSHNTRTDIMALRKKEDDTIYTSAIRRKGEYEDEEQHTWDLYTYTYYTLDPNGNIYEQWIEREVAGEKVHRILLSTVDAHLFVNYIPEEENEENDRFNKPFPYGELVYNTYTFDKYTNAFKYLNEVVEGRWNAGDIHVNRKEVDENSSEPEYNGSLEVDGASLFHDKFTINNEEGIDGQDISITTNEIQIEVKKDEDEERGDLTIHVENDVNTRIDNDSHTDIGNDSHTIITNDRITTIGNDAHTEIGHDSSTIINNDNTVNITHDNTEVIGNDNTVNIGNDSGIIITGSENKEIGGNYSERITGNHSSSSNDRTIETQGDLYNTTNGNEEKITGGSRTTLVGAIDTLTTFERDVHILGDDILGVSGNRTETIYGTDSETFGIEGIWGNKVLTGPSTTSVINGDEEKFADYNYKIKENVQIGEDEDKRDLKVTGTITAGSIELDTDDNKLLFLRNKAVVTQPNTFIGKEEEFDDTEYDTGALVIF